jgi:hypothetical protein
MRLKISLLFCFLTISLLALAAGCTQSNSPETQNHLNFSINTNNPSGQRWYVPAGENIEITITNTTEQTLRWIVLARPLDGPFDANEQSSILVKIEIPASEDVETNFDSPAAPGEYDVLLINADGELQETARLITVRQTD